VLWNFADMWFTALWNMLMRGRQVSQKMGSAPVGVNNGEFEKT
jgi:hypothetical protein